MLYSMSGLTPLYLHTGREPLSACCNQYRPCSRILRVRLPLQIILAFNDRTQRPQVVLSLGINFCGSLACALPARRSSSSLPLSSGDWQAHPHKWCPVSLLCSVRTLIMTLHEYLREAAGQSAPLSRCDISVCLMCSPPAMLQQATDREHQLWNRRLLLALRNINVHKCNKNHDSYSLLYYRKHYTSRPRHSSCLDGRRDHQCDQHLAPGCHTL